MTCRLMKLLVVVCCVTLVATENQVQAAPVSIPILDIGTFADYTGISTATYSGTGFVGMYETEFGHLFGVELSDFSRTALQADISAFAGMTILSAFLEFDLLHGEGGTQDVLVTSFTANGTLGHFWNPPDDLGHATHSVTGQTSNSLDVTSFVQERISSSASWLGLHLQGSNLFQWTYTWPGFGFHADSAQVRLVIDAFQPNGSDVPEPTSLALFGLTALGMGIGARRRRRLADRNDA